MTIDWEALKGISLTNHVPPEGIPPAIRQINGNHTDVVVCVAGGTESADFFVNNEHTWPGDRPTAVEVLERFKTTAYCGTAPNVASVFITEKFSGDVTADDIMNLLYAIENSDCRTHIIQCGSGLAKELTQFLADRYSDRFIAVVCGQYMPDLNYSDAQSNVTLAHGALEGAKKSGAAGCVYLCYQHGVYRADELDKVSLSPSRNLLVRGEIARAHAPGEQ